MLVLSESTISLRGDILHLLYSSRLLHLAEWFEVTDDQEITTTIFAPSELLPSLNCLFIFLTNLYR
jgi:hypothetical protein